MHCGHQTLQVPYNKAEQAIVQMHLRGVTRAAASGSLSTFCLTFITLGSISSASSLRGRVLSALHLPQSQRRSDKAAYVTRHLSIHRLALGKADRGGESADSNACFHKLSQAHACPDFRASKPSQPDLPESYCKMRSRRSNLRRGGGGGTPDFALQVLWHSVELDGGAKRLGEAVGQGPQPPRQLLRLRLKVICHLLRPRPACRPKVPRLRPAASLGGSSVASASIMTRPVIAASQDTGGRSFNQLLPVQSGTHHRVLTA